MILISYNYFDTDYLQKFADRILRYEISIRNGYMSSVYKQKVFKSKNRIYQEEKKEYKQLHSRSKAGQELSKLNQKEREFYKLFKKNLQRTHKFYPFLTSLEEEELNDLPIQSEMNIAWSTGQPFTRNLMIALLKDFWQKVTDFQPKESLSINELGRRIDEKNNNAKMRKAKFKDVENYFDPKEMKKTCGTGLSKNKILMIAEMLKIYSSFDEIEKLGRHDRTTIWRWKKQFEALGYSRNAITDYIPIPVKNDFESYYTELLLTGSRVIQNRKMR